MNLLFFLRWWYCRWWYFNDKWLNIRDKIMHLVLMLVATYSGLGIFVSFHLSKTWAIFLLFQIGLIKEIRDYITDSTSYKDEDNLFISQLENIFDMLFNVIGMVLGWSIFHNFYSLSAHVILTLIMLMTYGLNQIHFSVDGSHVLVYNRLYLLDDYPVYTGLIEGKNQLLHEWADKRIIAFHEWLTKKQLEERDKTEGRFNGFS